MSSHSSSTINDYKRLYYLDLPFPFIYCPFVFLQLGISLNCFKDSGFPKGYNVPLSYCRRVITALPLIAGIFDTFENVIALYIINQYESGNCNAVSSKAAMMGGVMTLCKWNFLIALPVVYWVHEILLNPKDDEVSFQVALEKFKAKGDGGVCGVAGGEEEEEVVNKEDLDMARKFKENKKTIEKLEAKKAKRKARKEKLVR